MFYLDKYSRVLSGIGNLIGDRAMSMNSFYARDEHIDSHTFPASDFQLLLSAENKSISR